MTIKIYDYNDKAYEYELPEEFDVLHVIVVTGDEVVSVLKDSRVVARFDPQAGNRLMSYFDMDYYVEPSELEAWATRGGSYDCGWQVMDCKED